MSCAWRNASRDRPSRKSPAIASRGAKAMACTRPSRLVPALAQLPRTGRRSARRSVTSQGSAMLGAELLRHVGDAVLEALVLVGEGELGAFAARRLRDAVGDRAVAEQPVTRIFLPERSMPRVAAIILSGLRAALPSCLIALGTAPSAALRPRRRSTEDPARHFPGGRNRLRPGEGLRLLLGHRDRGDLRAAAHLRLPRAPGEAGAEHRRSAAAGHRRRQDLSR